MKQLFCDCKTDEEKANFFLSGRAVETGIVASAISNDVAMAYHRCAQFKKENDALRAELSKQQALTDAAQHIAEVAQSRANQLRAKVAEMERQEPVAEWLPLDSGEDTRRD